MQDSETVPLIGYGTLMIEESLAKTIGTSAYDKDMQPVTVDGYRRLFNLEPPHYESSYKLSDRGIETGAMNVEQADDQSFNALMFYVTEDELAAIDERESEYEKTEVPVRDFYSGKDIGEAALYTLEESDLITRDPDRLMPRWHDLVLTRERAYSVSEAFGEAFDRTTFLADGETPAVERYSSYL